MPNIERLQQLRRVVEAAPDDRLHMRAWSERAECGTAYCAAGWAALDPWFQENTPILGVFEITETKMVESLGNSSIDLADLFGITSRDASALFATYSLCGIGPHAISKAEVLANIDRLIAGDSAKRYAATLRGDD